MEMLEHGLLKMKVIFIFEFIQSAFSINLDGFKICDGEITRQTTSDQILLDYISRDKQVARLKYELLIGENEKYSMVKGGLQPMNQTDSIIEFILKIDQTQNNAA